MAYFVTRWGDSGARPEADHTLDDLFATVAAEVSLDVACTPEAAWDLVSDITRIGEFSPECVESWWLPGDRPGAVGSRFEGRNREEQDDDVVEWIRLCIVEAWVPGRTFAWLVGDRYDGTPATRWSFEVEPRGSGVRLTQRFQHLPDGLSGLRGAAEDDPSAAADLVAERLTELRAGMLTTLGRMRVVLERPSPPSR